MTSSMYGLLSKAPYGVYAVDMSQTILFWNRSAERILGHTADEAVGLRCYEVLQSLPESGTVPVCLQGCPAIRLAREGRVPSVVNVAARCAAGRTKAHYSNPADYRDGRAEGAGTSVPRAGR